jgi:hypothetical protein
MTAPRAPDPAAARLRLLAAAGAAVSIGQLIRLGRELCDPPGNPEYERGVTELAAAAAGLAEDGRTAVAAALGLDVIWLCDRCREAVTGQPAECQDDCPHALDHNGPCLARLGGLTECQWCGCEDRLHETSRDRPGMASLPTAGEKDDGQWWLTWTAEAQGPYPSPGHAWQAWHDSQWQPQHATRPARALARSRARGPRPPAGATRPATGTPAMKVTLITARDIARCPRLSLQPSHYRQDGACHCASPRRRDVPLDLLAAADDPGPPGPAADARRRALGSHRKPSDPPLMLVSNTK